MQFARQSKEIRKFIFGAAARGVPSASVSGTGAGRVIEPAPRGAGTPSEY